MSIKIDYEYINSQTGNVIGHLSLLASLTKVEQISKLDKKRTLLATSHKLGIEKIYWQDKAHSIG
jgi:hypothetical protein